MGGVGWGGHVNVLSSAYIRCCYSAEISVYACYVTCCYAAEISGILATLHVATLQRSLVSLLRYMLLRCRDVQRGRSTIKCHTGTFDAAWTSLQTIHSQLFGWLGTKMSCYMPKCGNGDSSTSTRSCFRRLQRCCEISSEKGA